MLGLLEAWVKEYDLGVVAMRGAGTELVAPDKEAAAKALQVKALCI